MNNKLISIILLGMLLLFILSPFSALAGLMLIIFIAATYNLLINLFQALIGDKSDIEKLSKRVK